MKDWLDLYKNSRNTHVMSLNPDTLILIKNGTKTIKMRLYNEKIQEIENGDYITFIST